MMIRSEGCRPAVSRSKFVKPVGTPVIYPSCSATLSIFLKLLLITSLRVENPSPTFSSAISKIDCSARSRSSSQTCLYPPTASQIPQMLPCCLACACERRCWVFYDVFMGQASKGVSEFRFSVLTCNVVHGLRCPCQQCRRGPLRRTRFCGRPDRFLDRLHAVSRGSYLRARA